VWGRLCAILSSRQEGRRRAPFCSRLRRAGEQHPCKDEPWAVRRMCAPSAPCQPLHLSRRAVVLLPAAAPLQLLSQGQGLLPIIISGFAFCLLWLQHVALFGKSALGVLSLMRLLLFMRNSGCTAQMHKQATFRKLVKLQSFGQGSKNVLILFGTLLCLLDP